MSVPDDAVVRPGARVDEALARVLGERTAAPLAKLGLKTTGDLLRHYPRRYTEPGTFTNLTDLAVGEHVTVQAEVRQVTVREMRSRGGAMLQAVVTDGVRTLQLTFFAKRRGVLRVHEQRLVPGRTGLFTGVVSDYRGQRQLTHPDYQLIGVDAEDEAAALVEASRPIPLYPASAAVPTWRIQRCVRTVLDPLTDADLPDPIPAEVRSARGLVGLREALTDVHEPFTDEQWRRGRDRLRYEEAFVLQAELARRRQLAAGSPAVARPRVPGGLLDAFDARLPFTLTDGQRAVGAELEVELAAAHPMQRLLQGEVGSGKTVVALRAMLQVVDAHGQAALLAPTEVLAAQHVRTLRALLGDLAEGGFLGGDDLSTRVALLTGSQGASARRENLLDAASGRAGIVVGTHALLSETVQFADLGLVVVDEQHRFGVEQRDTLRAKAAQTPHLLVMTATPIPRTVAMTVFGDLETSTLSEIPAGRSGVTTVVVPADNTTWVARTWQRVREEVEKGGRAYVVCPRIDPDDEQPGARRRSAPGRGAADDDGADLLSWDEAAAPTDEPDADEPSVDDVGVDGLGLDLLGVDAGAPPRRPLRAVLEVADELRALPALAGIEIGTLHGRMAADEKDRALAEFTSGRVPVLVSTTVIEVGVDVTDATAMVVLDADRFGISQLHQLRGRVGRGAAPGLCLLVADAPDGSPAAARLATLAATTDGFELATVDLELRREGDVLGAAQSGGASSLRLLRVARDGAVIERARADAREVVGADPDLRAHLELRAAIDRLLVGEREEFIDRA
ncbi:ATP-dependent DNA helicase RecG [soil metagenome]